ncbi:hypothetical protein [Paraburkholderia aspalathi]|uniref:hypothetical protein n=1 Tax=Paraburkholderia aspalathi TaxID=1324617 RepID=UPI001F3C0F46|nr:hypothetical protein [Paraburkholderia aspalathi]
MRTIEHTGQFKRDYTNKRGKTGSCIRKCAMKTPKEQSVHDVNEDIWHDLIKGCLFDDGAAAREHLEAGFPIYYREDDTPGDLLIKEHPDGRRELVRFHEAGDEVIRVLWAGITL